MSYRYIALTEYRAGNTNDPGDQLAHRLRELGLEVQGRIGRLTLFTSEKTPIIPLPGGGMLLGDLYDKGGKPIVDLAGLSHQPTQTALRQHLLDHCWGEYLLFQHDEEDAANATIMRDPSGGVTCAYSLRDGHGFITSDLGIASALGLHRDRIDWDFVSHCLVYPHMKISRTGLADVSELLPGVMLSIDGKAAASAPVWSPWTFVAPGERQRDPTAAARMVREVTTSVVQAMAETDQSLLLELSGGLDSSIVGACLAKVGARVACCTAVTPVPGADERRYAGQIAEQLGLELLQQPLDFEETDIEFPLPRQSLRPAVWVLGHAVARAMDAAADRQGLGSHMSGSGGDMVFCYLKSAAPAADAFRERGLTAGCRAIIDLSRLHGCTVAKAARLTLRKLYRQAKPGYKPDHSLLARTDIVHPLELHPWFSAPNNSLAGDRERIFGLAGNQMFADATPRGGNRRVRMPLLSQPVMEACLRVPSRMWIAEGRNRAIARSAFSAQLPQDVLNRRSKGTFVNYTFGMYNRNKETIRKFLLDGHLQSHRLLDAPRLNLFLDSQLAARDRSFMRIFDLCMIENWVRNHA